MEATSRCTDRWGLDKVTIDDIARESGVSRATLYRIFPGGRDTLFEACRVYELDEFFTRLLAGVQGLFYFRQINGVEHGRHHPVDDVILIGHRGQLQVCGDRAQAPGLNQFTRQGYDEIHDQ